MPLNSKVVFEPYALSIYKDVSIAIHHAGQHLVPSEELTTRFFREGEAKTATIVQTIQQKDFSYSFSKTRVVRMPSELDIIAPTPAKQTLNGYYHIDSVFACGSIPTYSLFAGSGNWNDTTKWSHLPAERHRTALLKGNVTIDSAIDCDQIAVANGTIAIASSGELSTNMLTIHSNDQSPLTSGYLHSSGVVHIKDKIMIQKTFAEKGKWYFISFPFDVYASGIDPNFQMSDDQHDTNGNYLYVQTYNGDKRSSTQNATNNWDVLPASIATTDQPIFKKNQGYLIAIDAAANTNTLSFSSQANTTPAEFGKLGEIIISILPNNLSENTEHKGWFLCGNPFPAPLNLQDLQDNSDLDGYIYVYDGVDYQPYAIGSDYAIPPFSAFFVKAKQNTRLTMETSSLLRSGRIISNAASMNAKFAEPKSAPENITSNQIEKETDFSFQLHRNELTVNNVSATSKAKVVRSDGKLMWQNTLPKGTSVHSLPVSPGVYVLIVQTDNKIIQEKIRINL